MNTIKFSVLIDAPLKKVWHSMLDDAPYREWTSCFAEGSYYEGSWDQDATIHFLTPEGSGMVSEIAENRYLEKVSIRHLGTIQQGKIDMESAEVKAWTPCYETYTFTQKGNATDVTVTMDTVPEYEAYFQETWPKALAKLKELCEE